MKKILLAAFVLVAKIAGAQTVPTPESGQALANQRTAQVQKAAVTILPGASQNRAELSVKGFKEGAVQVSILSADEKVLKQEQRFLITGEEQLSTMYLLPKGIYFLLVAQNDIKVKQKLLVH